VIGQEKSCHRQTGLKWLLVERTYSESRIELQNLQILKKMLEKSTQFLSPEQPCGPKSLNVSLNIAGVERKHSENMRLRSTLDAI